VLVTTAATGQGVAELLAAIDRHRTSARDSLGSDARLKRAEAQVWAVLVDRLHQRVRRLEGAPDGAAGELLPAVAAHELDPFAAADALLELLTAPDVGTGGIGREDGRED
jgi:LAO/AO transport system kinase